MKNRVCELLGCKYPIIEGGLAYVGNGSLAAAVSNGGGFGQVGSGGRTATQLAQEIEIAMRETKAPFGVNIPISEHRDPQEYFKVVETFATQIKAVSLSAGNPRPFIGALHDLGILVMTLASTPAQARKAEEAGADIVICEGFEAGGHNGPAEITSFTLIPSVVDAVSIPVVAAGGIVDGRGIAAALMLGADAVQIGTRFVATHECEAHHEYKEALVRARVEDTQIMEKSFGRVTRVLKSPFVDHVLEQERLTPGSEELLLPLVRGKMNAVAALDGKMSEGWVNAGQSAGLIQDVPSATELVHRLIHEAEARLQTVRL